MNATPSTRRQLEAPRDNRAALVDPPLEQAGRLAAENVRLRRQASCDLHGRSLAELAQLARRELFDAARHWTAAYRDVSAGSFDPATPIFLAGHQPQMFHPGVWLKNFALGALAKRHGAAAINLLVDSDTLSSTALRVPGGTAAEPRVEPLAFDLPEPAAIPYEERRIVDREMFAAFGRRAAEQIAPLVTDPLVGQYWPMVVARMRDTDKLGACLAQARHQLEGRWGLETLEVPQSAVCGGAAFQWFAAHLLAELPRLRHTYNEAIHEYRRAHRVRSSAHPAPDLAEEGEWLEAPFWVWTAGDPHRRRLFARFDDGAIMLSDRQQWQARLPLRADGDLADTAERLMELQHSGVRIRSRALITTFWARLALGDLFVHGIGGAKYDEVTDRLIERFFGLQPPALMVISGTLQLPIERPRAIPANALAIQHELRDMLYHPERFLDGVLAVPSEVVEAKRRWVNTPQTRENARERCQAIRRANESLQPWLIERREWLERSQAEAVQRLDAESILAWREYAFCLYPEPVLREFFSTHTDAAFFLQTRDHNTANKFAG